MADMQTSLQTTRLASLRTLLAEKELDALLVSGPENRRFLSGFSAREEMLAESCGSLLISAGAAYLLTDFRYRDWAAREAPAFEVLTYQAGLGDTLAGLLKELGIRRLGFEAGYLTCRSYERLAGDALQAGVEVEWSPREGMVESLREVKTPEEAALMRRALALTEAVFREVAPLVTPGLTERRVAWEIERRLREGGAHGLAFSPIVAAGPNSARPHHHPGDYALREGDPVILDLGARLEGYCADLTRTLCLGPPSDRFREVYRTVREAQRRAEAGIVPGMMSDAADALAREVIMAAGYGEAFGHSLGHGVGLAVHEAPSLSPYKDRVTPLKAGSIFTVEPGIYLTGWGGVRLEDMVLLHEDRAEVLTSLGFLELE
ncbi:MAG: aminopeptidase P family protein [Deltaproteobacteria bacterium]|nr:aminopeptidase P family protein [Deltaproteobacteria bacterium]